MVLLVVSPRLGYACSQHQSPNFSEALLRLELDAAVELTSLSMLFLRLLRFWCAFTVANNPTIQDLFSCPAQEQHEEQGIPLAS
jgi:hypothetical protein